MQLPEHHTESKNYSFKDSKTTGITQESQSNHSTKLISGIQLMAIKSTTTSEMVP